MEKVAIKYKKRPSNFLIKKQIFFDVTLLCALPNKPAGITKICSESSLWFIEKNLQNIEFVYYDFQSNEFWVMPKLILKKIISEFEKGTLSNLTLDNLLSECSLELKKEIKIELVSFDRCSCFFDLSLVMCPRRMSKILEVKKIYNFKLVMTCYDLIPIFCPYLGFNDPLLINGLNNYFSFLLKNSDYIFSISNSTNNDIRRFALKNKITLPPISIIKNLGTKISKIYSQNENSHLENLLKKDFILCVSNIEKRKNHEMLYKAYWYLLEQGFKDLPKLVFCGPLQPGMEYLIETIKCHPEVSEYIIILNKIKEQELKWLYENCLFTLYPSFYEGYGLPIMESLGYGRFCISSNATSLPEVGKNYIDYVHPLDVVGWAEKILFYIKNRDELSRREKYINETYTVPMWNDYISNIYKEICCLI